MNEEDDDEKETVLVFYILEKESLTAESQKLAEDADIGVLEIHPLFTEFSQAAKEIDDGAVFTGSEGIQRHAKRCAACAIVSFELLRNEHVAFPIKKTIVPILLNESLGTALPLVNGKLLSRGKTSKETLYRHATHATGQYIHFRDIAETWKLTLEAK